MKEQQTLSMDFRKELQSKSYVGNVDTVKDLESKYEISPHKEARAYFFILDKNALIHQLRSQRKKQLYGLRLVLTYLLRHVSLYHQRSIAGCPSSLII